jgi:fluoroacetyl-CoA thioesterase
MKHIFEFGAVKKYMRIVAKEDLATFDSGAVHPVYATFALGRDAEWTCRLFVLDMKETDEEGIGTYLNVTHHSPALLGQQVDFTAILVRVEGNKVECSFEAKVGDRLIASGQQGQKIIKREKIEKLFASL